MLLRYFTIDKFYSLRLHPSAPRTERVALKDDIIPLKKGFSNREGLFTKSFRVKAGQASGNHFQNCRINHFFYINAQVFHIPMMSMNVDTEVWGQDAASFRPERWITPGGIPASRDLPRGWNGIMTFLDGPRVCLGYRLGRCQYFISFLFLMTGIAVFELKVILATLLRSLEFHVTQADVKTMLSQTLQPVVNGQSGMIPLHVTLAASA